MTDTIVAASPEPAPDPASDAPTQPATGSSAASTPGSTGSWATIVPGVIIVLLLGVLVMGAVALQRRDDTGASGAPQIGWMRQGCEQWASSARGGSASGAVPDAAWCASMASWMSDHMGPGGMAAGQMGSGQMGAGQMGPGQMSPGTMGPGGMGQGQMGPGQMGPGQIGQGQMTGSMMWQSPSSMQATCEQWAGSAGAPAGPPSEASARCAQMVTWMTQHMGDWNRWMRDGPMAG